MIDKNLRVKPKSECKWDEVSLGEVMLRLDPFDSRIKTSRFFRVYEGGGEYNVARGLKKCFGLDTTVVTGIIENEIGYLLQDLINQGDVDMSYVKWIPFDGIGNSARIGLNFTERGFGIRGAITVYDRANSAASKLKVGDIDWDKIFNEEKVRWFHTGGIFAALSETTPEVIIEAMKCAKKNNVVISYDLNYRASLWKRIGGQKKAVEINREIAEYVDVMFGNEEDFTAALGFKVNGLNEKYDSLDTVNFKKMINECIKEFKNLKVVATTLRKVKTASINDWGAIIYYNDDFVQAKNRENLEVYDRVGGGDSFASGIIYGFLTNKPIEEIIEYGVVHGALAMTTPGDTSMASLKEIEKIIGGGGARIDR